MGQEILTTTEILWGWQVRSSGLRFRLFQSHSRLAWSFQCNRRYSLAIMGVWTTRSFWSAVLGHGSRYPIIPPWLEAKFIPLYSFNLHPNLYLNQLNPDLCLSLLTCLFANLIFCSLLSCQSCLSCFLCLASCNFWQACLLYNLEIVPHTLEHSLQCEQRILMVMQPKSKADLRNDLVTNFCRSLFLNHWWGLVHKAENEGIARWCRACIFINSSLKSTSISGIISTRTSYKIPG